VSVDLRLLPEEIYALTGYRRQTEQLRELAALGIPARRQRDNSICVLRAHALNPPTKLEPPRPRLKL
jgi:hypothetical protein